MDLHRFVHVPLRGSSHALIGVTNLAPSKRFRHRQAGGARLLRALQTRSYQPDPARSLTRVRAAGWLHSCLPGAASRDRRSADQHVNGY
jgi:hypothetical protein